MFGDIADAKEAAAFAANYRGAAAQPLRHCSNIALCTST